MSHAFVRFGAITGVGLLAALVFLLAALAPGAQAQGAPGTLEICATYSQGPGSSADWPAVSVNGTAVASSNGFACPAGASVSVAAGIAMPVAVVPAAGWSSAGVGLAGGCQLPLDYTDPVSQETSTVLMPLAQLPGDPGAIFALAGQVAVEPGRVCSITLALSGTPAATPTPIDVVAGDITSGQTPVAGGPAATPVAPSSGTGLAPTRSAGAWVAVLSWLVTGAIAVGALALRRTAAQ